MACAALEEIRKILTDAGVEISYDKPAHVQSAAAAEFLRMEADWESAYLLSLRAAWQADNKIPNSKEASMSKAKAGRMATDVTLKTVELAGTAGYSEQSLLEKWARDSKILTSSRAPSRSSSWWWRAACWACRRPNSSRGRAIGVARRACNHRETSAVFSPRVHVRRQSSAPTNPPAGPWCGSSTVLSRQYAVRPCVLHE